jgi:chromosome segregation ATPase
MAELKGAAPMVDTSNTIPQEKIEPYIRKIESFLRDLASERGAYMNVCKGLRDGIREVIREANDNGVPRGPMKAAIETLKTQRKLNEIRQELEEDMQAIHDQIVEAVEGLEDLPLGIAAVERETRERATRRSKKRSPVVEQLASNEAPAP